MTNHMITIDCEAYTLNYKVSAMKYEDFRLWYCKGKIAQRRLQKAWAGLSKKIIMKEMRS